MIESSILSQHLSLTRALPGFTPTPALNQSTVLQAENSLLTLSESVANTSTTTTNALSSSRSIVAQTLEKEMGVSVREAINNAMQTGAEEQVEDLAAVAKVMLKG